MADVTRILASIKLNATLAAAVVLLTANHPGTVSIAELLFLVKLNVFALPIVYWTDMFTHDPWVWYVISLLWGLQAMHYLRVSVRDAAEYIVPGDRD
mgnify:FL=1